MSEPEQFEGLIEALAGELHPVRRLRSPWVRALGWLGVVVAAGFAMAAFDGTETVLRRFVSSIDGCAAILGAVATAVTAACAAFLLSVPGRRPEWALLPIPPAIVWALASGMDCVDTSLARFEDAHPPLSCFTFIVGVSVPFSVLLYFMLRRAYPVRPGLTAALGGLAAAAAAATLLEFVHPFDLTVPDLFAHAGAVVVVIGANRALLARAF